MDSLGPERDRGFESISRQRSVRVSRDTPLPRRRRRVDGSAAARHAGLPEASNAEQVRVPRASPDLHIKCRSKCRSKSHRRAPAASDRPDLIFGFWSGKKFQPERVAGLPSFAMLCEIKPQSLLHFFTCFALPGVPGRPTLKMDGRGRQKSAGARAIEYATA